MKQLHALCAALMWLWALAAGALCLGLGLSGGAFPEWAARRPWLLAAAGATALLAALLRLAGRGGDRGFVSFDTGTGRVGVSLEAIREYLGRVGSELPAVASLRPSIRGRKEGVEVTLDLRLRAGASVPETTRALQDRVRFGMEQELGLPPLAAVRVRITSLAAGPGAGEPPAEGGGEAGGPVLCP